MLSQMRQNTKTIMWIVIVGFVGLIFAVWGMNLRSRGGVEAGLVGKIGRDRVTVEEYRNEVQNQRAAYYQSENRRPGSREEQMIADNAWEAIVQRHILWKEAADQGLLPTNEEIRLEIQTNPPPFIRGQPIFQTDSVYDHSKYLAALDDPAYDFSFLEDYVRATLPLQKLQDYISSSVRVTEEEARSILGLLEDQVSISYIVVSPTVDVRQEIPEPAESELEAFYSEHLEDFRIPEKRVLEYVQLPKAPSVEDETYAREKIEEAYDLIGAGEPFGEIAADYSDDERSRAAGGDLGWVRRGFLPQELDSVAFSLGVGAMSDIIRTNDAFHIIRVEDRRQEAGVEEAHLSLILTRLEASPLTLEQLSLEASDLVTAARRKGVEEAAVEAGFEFERSNEMAQEQLAPVLGISRDDAKRLFDAARSDILGPIEGSRAFHVIRVAEINPSHVPALEEIKDFVKQSYRFDRKKQMARAVAEEVEADLAAGKTLEQAASARGLRVEKSERFTRRSTVAGIGSENVVVATAFALDPKQTSGIIEHAGQFYIVRVDERQDLDEDRFRSNLQTLMASLMSTKRQVFITEWYQHLRSASDIEDYRSLGPGY